MSDAAVQRARSQLNAGQAVIIQLGKHLNEWQGLTVSPEDKRECEKHMVEAERLRMVAGQVSGLQRLPGWVQVATLWRARADRPSPANPNRTVQFVKSF